MVTSFEYHLHQVGPIVLAGVMLYPAVKAREVLGSYRDFIATAPNEVTTIVVLRMAPPAPFLPPSVHGQPVVVIGACYAGSVEEGERVVAPLPQFGEPLVDVIRPTPYVSHQAFFDPTAPHGLGYYWKSEYVPSLSDVLIDTLAQRAWSAPTPESYTIIFTWAAPSVDRIRKDRPSRTGGGPTR